MVRLTKKEVFSTNIKRFWFHKSIIVIKIIRVIVHLLIIIYLLIYNHSGDKKT